jgi:hypothetical protein
MAHTFQIFLKAHNANMYNFFKMNLFQAALTPELRAVIAQQDQQTMTMKKMYDCATTAQREGKDFTKSAIINEVEEDLDYNSEPEEEPSFQMLIKHTR